MSKRIIFGALVAVAGAVVVVILVTSGGSDAPGRTAAPIQPGQATVEIISPRNGSRQQNRSAVVKVRVENFQMAPLQFGKAPQFGEGNIRFSLNRVPNCVRPEALEKALNSPTSAGRLIGKSYDFPRYSGPNGVLAEEIGTAGLYSPATKPEVYYQHLPPGFYRLVVTLAQNNGSENDAHSVTNFEVLSNPRAKPPPAQDCKGKVSSTEAAKAISS